MGPSMPDSTHGVPSKGNGGMIALGVIMLLAAGGLVVWKMQSKASEPEVVEEAPAAKAVEPPAPVLDNAPPPPPSEEEIEEEEKEEEKAAAATGPARPAGPAGCSGSCTGSMTPALNSALGARGGMSRSCYNTALRRNAGLEGKMTVSVRLSPNGSVCGASISNNTVGDPSIGSCVLSKFRSAKFPAPQGGCIDTAVPLNFTKK